MQSRFPPLILAVSASMALALPVRAERPADGQGVGKPKDGAPKPSGAAPKPSGGAPTPSGPAPGDGRPRAPKQEPEADLTPEAALARASAYYEAGQYAQCADSLTGILNDPDKVRSMSPRSRDQAEVYDAACLIAIGNTEAADERFRAAIRENPQMAVPSAVVFPPAVIERFVVVRSELLEEIRRSEQERVTRERTAAQEARKRAEVERRRIVMLEKIASEETLIQRNSRWIATVPFGVGQFQNRDYALGAVFLTSEALLLATAVVANAEELHFNSIAQGGAGFNGSTPVGELNQKLKTSQIVALSATGGLILVAAGGIVQAQLGFVPEFRDGTRPRKIPKTDQSAGFRPSLSPVIGPTTGGAAFGVLGRF